MNDSAFLLLRIVAGFGLASHGYNAIVNGGVEAIEGFAGYLKSLSFPAPEPLTRFQTVQKHSHCANEAAAVIRSSGIKKPI